MKNSNATYCIRSVDRAENASDWSDPYYFKVNNHSNSPISYDVILEKVSPNTVNDGCDDTTLFLESELDYELKLDNKVIATGTLSSLKNNLLNSNSLVN